MKNSYYVNIRYNILDFILPYGNSYSGPFNVIVTIDIIVILRILKHILKLIIQLFEKDI
jgi:hypothetical protein